MCNALNLLSWAGWSVISSFSCLVPHGVCKPWKDCQESGKLESSWHMKSFLKCHCMWHEGWFQCLCLPSGPFSDRCSRWTSLTAFPVSMRPTLCQSRMPDDRGKWLCLYSQDSWHSCEWAAGTSSSAEGTAECSDLLQPWDQEHVASLESFMCPKFCRDLTDSNSRGGIAPLKLYFSWGRAQGLLSQVGQGSGSHNSCLRGVVRSQNQPAGPSLLCSPPAPNLHPRERQKLLWSPRAKAAKSDCGQQA